MENDQFIDDVRLKVIIFHGYEVYIQKIRQRLTQMLLQISR